MSDATLPPPRSSSVAPATGDGNRSDSSAVEHEHGSDTSFTQSTGHNINEDGAGGLEGRPSNKQKRKRTSPKDQAILEAEYKQNPKPNKAARALIVEKVDLNEKEVQIWFQNRRQINRRKSRPLLPHELAAFGLGGMAALSSDPACAMGFSSSQGLEEPAVRSQESTTGSRDNETTSLHVQDDLVSQEPPTVEEYSESTKEEPANSESNNSLPQSNLRTQSSPETSSTEAGPFSATQSVIKTFSSTPGYLANRWNMANSSASTPSSSQNAPLVTPPISNPNLPSSCPERINTPGNFTPPPAKMRLSMSLDGKAELVSSDLSPPRENLAHPSSSESQRHIRGFQRSHSALPFGPLTRQSPTNIPRIPRLPRGRSRDARNWELFCDTEARDELTTQAENESSGSAVAAISLLRSASSAALKLNSNKRNAPPSRQDLNTNAKRPKLERAMSSLARLQGTAKPYSKPAQFSNGKDDSMRSPSGDSDKENWIPDSDGGNLRRRPLPSARTGRQAQSQSILGENHKIPTHAVNFGGTRNRGRRTAHAGSKIFEDQENKGEVNEEVEQFMRGEISPSKKGDLDCIQGLLSLSQGNWR